MGSKCKFEPDLEQVEELAASGLTQDQICLVLGINRSTLYRHKRINKNFADALKRGQATGVADVSSALKQSALDGNVTAQIFYLKNRDPENWRDRREHEGHPAAAQSAAEKPTAAQVKALAVWFNGEF